MYRKYGSMEYPDYVDSLSALYIIYKAFDYPNVQTWKQNYYLFVMLEPPKQIDPVNVGGLNSITYGQSVTFGP